jgi:hypothetical protein
MLYGRDPFTGRELSRKEMLENQITPIRDVKDIMSGKLNLQKEIAKLLDAQMKYNLKKKKGQTTEGRY